MRTDLESDLRLGYVHLNRLSFTSQSPLKTARAHRTPVHTHIYATGYFCLEEVHLRVGAYVGGGF